MGERQYKTPDYVRRAHANYLKKQKRFTVQYSTISEKEMVDWIEEHNKQEPFLRYVKRLIQEDKERNS